MLAENVTTPLIGDFNVRNCLGVIVAAGLFVYEHSLVSPDDLSRLDIAFFNINGYIAVILFAAVLGGRLAVAGQRRSVVKRESTACSSSGRVVRGCRS